MSLLRRRRASGFRLRHVTVSYPCLAPVRVPRSLALGQLVLGAAAALWWGQTAAFGGDRAALDAVRRCDIDALLRRLVDLRGTESFPELRDVLRNVSADDDVVRLVVARLVPRGEDGGELVEGELAVRRREVLRTVGSDQLDVDIPFELEVAPGKTAFRGGHRARERAAEPEPAAERRTHVAHLVQVFPDEAPLQRFVVDRKRTGRCGGLSALQGRE